MKKANTASMDTCRGKNKNKNKKQKQDSEEQITDQSKLITRILRIKLCCEHWIKIQIKTK